MARRSFLRLLAAAHPAGDHVPDAELLRRFAATRDPAAFELLVRRHARPPAAVRSATAAPAGVVNAAAAVVGGSVVAPPAVSSLAEGVLSAMRTAKLKLTAVVAAGLLGLAGTGTLIAVGQAPAPR